MARVSIEDCLENIENRFALVMVAAHRTRQLMNGSTPYVRTKNKEAVTSLREIADGYILPSELSTDKKSLYEMKPAVAAAPEEPEASSDES